MQVGDQLPFPVVLSTPAPASGVFITLAISNSAVASFNSTNVLLPGGETLSNRIRLTAVGVGTATVAAAAPGYSTVTQQVQVVPR